MPDVRVRHVAILFFFSSRRRHTRLQGDWSSDVCSSDLLFTEVEQRIRTCLGELGLEVKGWMESAIEGGDGNREFFVHAQQAAVVKEPAQQIGRASCRERV